MPGTGRFPWRRKTRTNPLSRVTWGCSRASASLLVYSMLRQPSNGLLTSAYPREDEGPCWYTWSTFFLSKTPEGHLEHLREVVALFSKEGLLLKADESHLLETKVEYLGDVLSPRELSVIEKDIVVARPARKPKSQTELKSFLALCSGHRPFVQDYSFVVRSLTKLTRKRRPAQLPVFNEKQTAACEKLQKKLTTTAVLALPKRECQLVMEIDTCGVWVGCFLIHEQSDGHLLWVGYYGRVLTRAEWTYSTTERECLIGAWACFLLRTYLEDQFFLCGQSMLLFDGYFPRIVARGERKKRQFRV